ncbi:Zn-ribbon domain-containing OB-fold protein, partial [Phenylobacterium sp.]|uniref:Zn-ribbon domain-containing OB-fold protein n=1 Tax=Phenylobacterium sp. TaxID=1871053 RepID=UPI00273005A7
SWTVTHQALHPAFATEIPYVAALVELDEGVRMASRLLNCDSNTLILGIPVELVVRELGDGFRLPCFQPSEQVAP